MQMIPSLFLFRLGAQAQSPVGAEVSWKQKADLDPFQCEVSDKHLMQLEFVSVRPIKAKTGSWQWLVAHGTPTTASNTWPGLVTSTPAPLNLLLEISVPEPIMAAGGQCSCD